MTLGEIIPFKPSISSSVKYHPPWTARTKPANVGSFLPPFLGRPESCLGFCGRLLSPLRPYPCPRSGDFLRSLKSFCFKGNPVPRPSAGEAADPSVRPRPPRAHCTPLAPRPAGGTGWWWGPATYLLLGSAELLLHLLGEQAGGASRLALRHPAGSGRPGPAACGFLEAPEEEVRFPACLASGRGRPAPRRSRPPRPPRLLPRPAPGAATVALRPPQAHPRSAPAPRGTSGAQAGGCTCSEEEAGNSGLPSGGAPSKSALKLRSPEGREHQPHGTEFSNVGRDPFVPAANSP